MIRSLLLLLGFVPRFSFPIGTAPVPLVRQGRVSGVRAAKRLSHKRRNQRRSRHV